MDCRDKTKEFLASRGTSLSDGDIDQLFDYFDKIKDSPDRKMLMQQHLETQQVAADALKVAHAKNILARENIANYAPDAKDNLERSLTYMAGSVKPFEGSGNSVDALQELWSSARMSALQADLTQAAGTPKIISLLGGGLRPNSPERRAFNLELAKALKLESTNDEMAKKVADVFHKHGQELVEKANSLGVPMQYLEDYAGAQTHDMFKLSRAAKILKQDQGDKESWISYIMPRLDPKTFVTNGEPQDAHEFLSHVYDDVLHGRYGIDGLGAEDDLVHTVSGMAKRMARHRVLHFKDARSFVEYNEMFGSNPGLGSSLISQYTNLERKLALIDRMGTNPKATAEWMAKNAGRKGEKVMHMYKTISGEFNVPVNIKAAHIAASTRAFMNITHLGGSMISSWPDLGSSALAMRSLGVPYAEGYTKLLGQLATHIGRGISSEENKAIARMVKIGTEGMMHRAASRWTEGLTGTGARLSTFMFHLNGQAWWDDIVRHGVAKIALHKMATFADTSYTKLDPLLLQQFKRFGIKAGDWNAIRKTVGDFGGDKLLTLDGLDNETESKFLLMLHDASRTGVPLPGARERDLWLWGQPGTVAGEMGRLLGQFKYFPTSILMRVAPKAYHMGLGHLILGYAVPLTVLGYISGAAKSVMEGNYPNDPGEAKTWVDAFSKGGAASYLGDLVMNDFGYGHSVLDMLGGPTFSTVNQALQAITLGKQAAFDQAKTSQATQAVKLLFRNMPFSNLPYTKAAVQTLMLDPLLNAINPGYVQREKARAAKQYGERSFIK